VPTALNPDFSSPYTGTDYDWTVLYTGRELDIAMGLCYYRRRYYHPVLGVFVSRDPIDYAGGLNLYGYCSNSPVRYSYPSGLELRIRPDPKLSPKKQADAVEDLKNYLTTICDQVTFAPAKDDPKSTQVDLGDMEGTQTPKGCCCVLQLINSSHDWLIQGYQMGSDKAIFPSTVTTDWDRVDAHWEIARASSILTASLVRGSEVPSLPRFPVGRSSTRKMTRKVNYSMFPIGGFLRTNSAGTRLFLTREPISGNRPLIRDLRDFAGSVRSMTNPSKWKTTSSVSMKARSFAACGPTNRA
jgi:RHS repeat-associated protein